MHILKPLKQTNALTCLNITNHHVKWKTSLHVRSKNSFWLYHGEENMKKSESGRCRAPAGRHVDMPLKIERLVTFSKRRNSLSQSRLLRYSSNVNRNKHVIVPAFSKYRSVITNETNIRKRRGLCLSLFSRQDKELSLKFSHKVVKHLSSTVTRGTIVKRRREHIRYAPR